MSIENYLEDRKKIQKGILDYLNNDSDTEEDFQNLFNLFADQKINEDKNKLEDTLYLITKISKYHQRGPGFSNKIDKILSYFKDEIKQTFSNSELQKIFKNNKRILYFLYEESIIKLNKSFVNSIFPSNSADYIHFFYFYPIFKPFFNKKIEQNASNIKNINQDSPEVFEQKAKKGENDHEICELIRNDSIDEFITFVSKNNVFHSLKIEESIFETNIYLIKNKPNLIEYSAFYGSAQIFKYLYMNGAELTPSLWLYSIHGNNPEIIKILEESEVLPNDNSYSECFNESIKCHNIEVSEYLLTNFIDVKSQNDVILHSESIKYYNYLYFPKDLSNPLIFYELCKYNHVEIVKYLLKDSKKIDINKIIILKILLFQ